MSRKMSAQEWHTLENAVVEFCELRAEYRRRKEAGTLGGDLEQRMIQDLNALEVHIERLKLRDEVGLVRASKPVPRVESRRVRKIAW